MNITVIGASAGVGLATVKRALDLGHKVTSLARGEVAVADSPNLNKIKGSALDADDLRRTIKGADAVLVTLGTGKNTSATTLYSDFARTLLALHAKEPISVPVIILTGFGSGDSRSHLVWFVRPLFALMLNKVYADKARMEDMISRSSLRWEIVRPGILTDRPPSEKYRVEPVLRPKMGIRTISRVDVADYMVREAEAPINLGKYPALTGR